MMPRSLTLERHGESEGNLVRTLFEKGNPHPNERSLMKVHTSHRRLTPKGVLQAKAAGEWLQREWLPPIQKEGKETRLFVSPYVRAMETAGHNGFGDRWRLDNRIMERDWGELDSLTYDQRMQKFADIPNDPEEDAFFWRPPGGEALFNVFLRLRDMCTTLHRECEDMHVLMVCHGETMWAWRALLEYWTPQRLALEMMRKSNKTRHINCRLIQYSRFAEDGSDAGKLCRVRFVNPSDPDNPEWNQGWQAFERPTYTHAQLLELSESYLRFLEDVA
jgi:broad specificity phosphatase PhoE